MKCSRCPNEARAGQRYCHKCDAEAQKRYRKHKTQLQFNKGVEALRRASVTIFERLGDAEMSGYTAAEIMRKCET